MDLTVLDGKPIHDDLQRLARYCVSLPQTNALPTWRDFRPAEANGMLDRLAVIDVLDGGADYYYRLSGGLLPQIFGGDLYGKRLSEAPGEDLKRDIKRVYDEVVKSRQPLWHTGNLHWPDGNAFRIEYILIPFTRDGAGADVILSGAACDVAHDELVLYRGKGIGVLERDG